MYIILSVGSVGIFVLRCKFAKALGLATRCIWPSRILHMLVKAKKRNFQFHVNSLASENTTTKIFL